MSIYELRKMNKEGTVFNAKDTFYTGEYAEQHMPLYLEGHIIVDENGRHRNRYRLHSDKATSIETALSYDINCPKCGSRLKQIGRCLNAHDLGLYKCPACDKN